MTFFINYNGFIKNKKKTADSENYAKEYLFSKSTYTL